MKRNGGGHRPPPIINHIKYKTMKEKVKIYFAGVDDWNRPTFREVLDNKRYYCDIYKLFDYNTTEETITAWYSLVGVAGIVFKGNNFDAEPLGTRYNVELVTRQEAINILKLMNGDRPAAHRQAPRR